MDASSSRPLNRDRAWAYVTMNFSLAGLGSLKAGRKIAGVTQLVTAFAGFFLCTAWIIKWIYRIYQSQTGEPLSPQPSAWLGQTGAACFVVSYVWMLWTCASLMWEAKANEKKASQNVPSQLVNPAAKPPKLS